MNGRHSWDRRLGQSLRRAVGALPGGQEAARGVSAAMEPGFQALVAAMLMRTDVRRAGFQALVGGAAASAAARLLRDAIGRPRPGGRDEGGFPSRHAAAAVAIACAGSRLHRPLRPWLVGATLVGLTARVVAGEHDPADIAAGALLGWSADGLVERVLGDMP